METPRCCETCLFLATHEDCDKNGGCLRTEADYGTYGRTGKLPPFRYLNWVESNPVEQMSRLHALQLAGVRNIVLGPGEAEVNAKWTPHDTAKSLHHVAEECGYVVDNLTHDRGDGKQSITVWKDFGPFRVEWLNCKLERILSGEKGRVFWEADDKLLTVGEIGRASCRERV